jgi:hypothetical protein
VADEHCGSKESKEKGETAGNLKAAINCLNWLARAEGKRKGGGRAEGKIAATRNPSGAEKGRWRGEGEEGGADRWGPGVSDRGKRKEERETQAATGKGEVGRWAEKVRRFPFSFFLFQTLFKSNLFNSNSNKTFQTFSQNFINFLNFTQTTKNHAKPNNDAETLVVSRLTKLN